MNKVISINISKGGVPKLPVKEAWISKEGVEGDKQKDLRYHGGPERAVCLFSFELIERLQSEGHPVHIGSTGENLTLSADDYSEWVPGCRIAIGHDVLLEITSYAAPCKTIKNSFMDEEFSRISHKLYPGQSRLYASVLKEGTVREGDMVRLLLQ